MTEPNESLGLSVAEHIEPNYEHAGHAIFDYALVNTGPIPPDILVRYAAEGAEPTSVDIERIEAMGIRCICRDLVAEGTSLRHAPLQVTEVVLALKRVLLSQRSEHTGRVLWRVPAGRRQTRIPIKGGTALQPQVDRFQIKALD